MTTPFVNAALLATIRGAGYHVGTATFLRSDGRFAYHADATDAMTGERWTVQGPTEYAALVELAAQIGIELKDG